MTLPPAAVRRTRKPVVVTDDPPGPDQAEDVQRELLNELRLMREAIEPLADCITNIRMIAKRWWPVLVASAMATGGASVGQILHSLADALKSLPQ